MPNARRSKLVAIASRTGLVALAIGGFLPAGPATGAPRPVAVAERYCATARQELAAHPLNLQLDERATPLATGVSEINGLRRTLSRIGAIAPAEIAPVYRESVGTLASLRSAWKTLKTSRSEPRKSNARIFLANSSASLTSLTQELMVHVSSNCQNPGSIPTTTPLPPNTPVVTVTEPPASAAPQPLGGNGAAWLGMVNQARSQSRSCGGTSFPATVPLMWDSRLEEAARVQSAHQRQIGTMTHTGAGGSNAGQRMSAVGFAWSGWAENVGWNYPGATEMMQGWMNSPGHCANIMRPEFTHVGWARVGDYDTMVLGRSR